MKLYSYWRSSSAYRVRIALNLKALPYELVPVHLVQDGGEQHQIEYRNLNPAGLVPLLVDDGLHLSQSLAIFDYLESKAPAPALLPSGPAQRARAWSLCADIACEIQPLQNLRVLQYLTRELGHSEDDKTRWARHWINHGLIALEQRLSECAGDFALGEQPSYVDCCLVPQMYNAERFDCELSRMPTLVRLTDSLRKIPEFVAAHPDQQPDAPNT